MLSIFKRARKQEEIRVNPPKLDRYELSDGDGDGKGLKIITEARINGFIQPTPDLRPCDIVLTVPSDENYEIIETEWWDQVGYRCPTISANEFFYRLDSNWQSPSKVYEPHLRIILKAKLGYVFEDTGVVQDYMNEYIIQSYPEKVGLVINDEKVQRVGDMIDPTTFYPEGWRWWMDFERAYNHKYSKYYLIKRRDLLVVTWTKKHRHERFWW